MLRVCRLLPPRKWTGADSSTRTESPWPRAVRAAHNAALPPPSINRSKSREKSMASGTYTLTGYRTTLSSEEANMHHIARICLAAALAAAGIASAQQNFPTRPVTLTVGFAPGGGTDTAARIVAKKLTENLGQSVVVENRAGAGGNIAAQHVANAPPDGYTIHLSSVGPLTVAPHMSKSLPYDVKRDLAPLTMGMV